MVGLPPSHARIPDSSMGHFRVAVQIGNRASERFEPIEAIVDSGARYTWVPQEVLKRLGVYTSRLRIGWSVRRKGSKTSPRISSVTTPRSASASPGWPKTTGV